MRKFINIFWVLVGFPEISMRVCKNPSMQVFWVQTFSTQFLPGPNFFKLSIPCGLRIFRAFASLFPIAIAMVLHHNWFLLQLRWVFFTHFLSTRGCVRLWLNCILHRLDEYQYNIGCVKRMTFIKQIFERVLMPKEGSLMEGLVSTKAGCCGSA